MLLTQAVDAALIDIRLDAKDARNRDGLELVREMVEQKLGTPIVVSVFGEMAEIRHAMRYGAYDYILKDDLSAELIEPIIRQIQERCQMKAELSRLKACTKDSKNELIGTSPAMQSVKHMADRLATIDRPVLILGPSGSGKELIARRIHKHGNHASEPFVAINCSAIPEALIESELLGHVRGSFTGAVSGNEGYFAAARQGTLFLDEIAELPLQLQPKLLRVLETRSFCPVGSRKERPFRGRIIAATHANLQQRVDQGLFREDLYYRLAVLEIHAPSLNERREDIPDLVLNFAATQHRELLFTQKALSALARADWPGNVRQLRNTIDRLAILTDDTPITDETVHRIMGLLPSDEDLLKAMARSLLNLDVTNRLKAVQDAMITQALQMRGGNKSAAAKLLGVHRKQVERRCRYRS